MGTWLCLLTSAYFFHIFYKDKNLGISLVDQGLRLCASKVGHVSSISGGGTKIPHAAWHSWKTIKIKQKMKKTSSIFLSSWGLWSVTNLRVPRVFWWCVWCPSPVRHLDSELIREHVDLNCPVDCSRPCSPHLPPSTSWGPWTGNLQLILILSAFIEPGNSFPRWKEATYLSV